MIFLMRHADAVSDEVDLARPLSARGREQVARVCGILAAVPEFKPVEIWHSPLVRSRETATLLAAGLQLAVPVLLKPGLEPDDDPGRIAAQLANATRDLALVGHEPHLGVLASILVHGPQPAGIFYPFSKASVIALTRSGNAWKSRWLVRSA
jgi:phosphohistidine phosphatase